MSHRSAIIAGLLSGLIAVTASPPVNAQPGPTLRISYERAELRTDAGARKLYGRIRRKAHNACASGAWGMHFSTVRRCRNELIELAVDKLADARIAGMHAGDRPVRFASRR